MKRLMLYLMPALALSLWACAPKEPPATMDSMVTSPGGGPAADAPTPAMPETGTTAEPADDTAGDMPGGMTEPNADDMSTETTEPAGDDTSGEATAEPAVEPIEGGGASTETAGEGE